MSTSRATVSHSAEQQQSLVESEKRSLIAALIAGLRAGENLSSELKQQGLQQMRTPDGVIWYKGTRPRNAVEFLELLRVIQNQSYEGEAYFIEDRSQQSQFTKKMLQIAEDLTQRELALRIERGEDAGPARNVFDQVLLVKKSFLDAELKDQALALNENKESMKNTSSSTIVNTANEITAKPKVKYLSSECMKLLLFAKKEFQKKKSTFEDVNLLMVLANYNQIISLLRNAILMYPRDTEEDLLEEYGSSLENFSGLLKKSDYNALLTALDQSLAEIVTDSLARQDNFYLELSYLCRSLVSSLIDGQEGTPNCMTYFQAGILVEPRFAIVATDSAHSLRLEALRTYSKTQAFSFSGEKDEGPTIPEKQGALFDKADTYMERAKNFKSQGNFLAAFINYSIAAWMIRADIDTNPSISLSTALHKKNKMKAMIEKMAAEKKVSTEKEGAPKKIQEDNSKEERKVSPGDIERAAATARELELEEDKAEKEALKKERRKNAKKSRAEAKKEEARKLAEQAELARIAKEKAEAELARIAKEKTEAELARIAKEKAEAELTRIAKEKAEAELARIAKEKAEAELSRIAKEKAEAELTRIAKEKAEAELARIAAEKVEADRKAVEVEGVRKMAEDLILKAAEEAVKIAAKKENPLQDFPPDALFPELSRDTIALLKGLSLEVEKVKKTGSKEAHLEIYGSFVLYYAMLALGKKVTRLPGDLDLLIQVKGLVFHNGRSLISNLEKLGFTVKESNSYKAYVKLEKTLHPSLGASGSQKGLYDISITVAFSGYKSVNRIHLTRHYLRFDPLRGLVSFDGGIESHKKELLDGILSGVGKVDLSDVMRPSLDVVNLFSRVLKFYFDYQGIFKPDEETTFKIISDWQWSKKYFINRLGKNCRAFHVNPELAKDNCYLEMADLIAKNYFSYLEAQAIIKGFVAVLVEILCAEKEFQPMNEAQLNEVSHKITTGLQARFYGSNYQAAGKKKAEIVADFHAALVHELSEVLRVNTLKHPAGVLSQPLIVQDFYQKLRQNQIREENECRLKLQASRALLCAVSTLPTTTHQMVVSTLAAATTVAVNKGHSQQLIYQQPSPVLQSSSPVSPSLEVQAQLTFAQLQAVTARVSNWQQAQISQSLVSQPLTQQSYNGLNLAGLWNTQNNKSLSYPENSRKIVSDQNEGLATVHIPQETPKY